MSKESEKKAVEEKKAKAREVNENRNAERLKLMEQIADTSEIDRIDPEEEPTEATEVKDAEVESAEATARELQQEVPQEKPEALSDEREIDGVKHYLVIVNGREKWLTLKQMRDTAAKVDAADDYLRTAAEAARRSAAEAPSQKDEPPNLEEDQIADLYRKQALGDEEAIKALAKLHARASWIPQDLLQAVDQRLSFRTELAALEAKSSDLLKDAYMGRLFRARINELKTESPNMGLSEAYTSVDAELRKAFPGFKSSKLQEKLERKRTLPQVPQAGTKQATETEEEGEEDPSSVIERMAKARGVTAHVHTPRRQ